MKTIERLEKKYGVRIVDDSFWHPLKGRDVKCYKMYSADGCPWENGMRTLKDVETECKKWESALLHIKDLVDKKIR